MRQDEFPPLWNTCHIWSEVSAYHINYGSLTNGAPASDLCLVSVIGYLKPYSNFVRHDCQEIEGQVFFYGFFFKGGTMLVVIQAVILACGEYLRTEKYYVLTSCSSNGGVVSWLSSISSGGSLGCSDTTSSSVLYSPSCALRRQRLLPFPFLPLDIRFLVGITFIAALGTRFFVALSFFWLVVLLRFMEPWRYSFCNCSSCDRHSRILSFCLVLIER